MIFIAYTKFITFLLFIINANMKRYEVYQVIKSEDIFYVSKLPCLHTQAPIGHRGGRIKLMTSFLFKFKCAFILSFHLLVTKHFAHISASIYSFSVSIWVTLINLCFAILFFYFVLFYYSVELYFYTYCCAICWIKIKTVLLIMILRGPHFRPQRCFANLL